MGSRRGCARSDFGALLDLIRRQMQTRLNQRVIQHTVLFAAGQIGEASQISQHGSQAILAVESEQGTRGFELVRGEVARDRRKALAQFYTILPVPAVSKTAEPVITVGLANGRAGTDHLPRLRPV